MTDYQPNTWYDIVWSDSRTDRTGAVARVGGDHPPFGTPEHAEDTRRAIAATFLTGEQDAKFVVLLAAREVQR